MKVIKERVTGETILSEDTQIQGVVTGRVYVENGVHLLHHGMIVGTVTVERGAEANIFGFVKGDIVNNGGNLYVFGTVNGTVRTESGNTRIDKEAFIKHEINVKN